MSYIKQLMSKTVLFFMLLTLVACSTPVVLTPTIPPATPTPTQPIITPGPTQNPVQADLATGIAALDLTATFRALTPSPNATHARIPNA